MLQASHCNTVTNKVKADIWKNISAKVSAVGVANRSVQDLKDKWRGLKTEAIRRKNSQRDTGGGPPERSSPYEMVMRILGESSALVCGIEGKGSH